MYRYKWNELITLGSVLLHPRNVLTKAKLLTPVPRVNRTLDEHGKCVFCRFNETKERIIYEDSEVSAFVDRKTIAKGYLQIITKRHIKNIYDLEASDIPLIKHM